jgi:hypothetical protein
MSTPSIGNGIIYENMIESRVAPNTTGTRVVINFANIAVK